MDYGLDYDFDNFTHNDTLHQEMDIESVNMFTALRLLRNIGIPVISVFGLLGNAVSLIVFSAQSMKQSSCTVFLAALAFVDNIFLTCLIVTWIDGEYYELMRYDFCCQLLIFFSYVSSFLSVWFIVSFTFERFIAICFPLKISYMCNIFREKVAVLLLCLIACMLYNFSFWTISLQPVGERLRCYHRMEFFDFLEIATWVDSVITLVIPFLSITIMNTLVVRTVRKCTKRSKAERGYVPNQIITLQEDRNLAARQLLKLEKLQRNRTSPHIRVTRTLLLVSTTFLCLNLPSHMMRLYNLFVSIVSPQRSEITMMYSFLQEVTLMLYYTTFSCNFILYAAFVRNFQNCLKKILVCRPTIEYPRDRASRRIASTRGSLVTSL